MPRILIILALIGMTAPGRSDPRQDHAAVDPCTLCSGTTKVACPTCAGKGRAALDCAMCRGVGKGPCLHCKLSGEVAAKLGDVKIKRGFLPCPNPFCDKRGKVGFVGSAMGITRRADGDPCKACDGKGTYRCPGCSDGVASCSSCCGGGRLEGTCGDCAGAGKLPCPGCTAKPTQKSCLFCRNEKKHSCELCKDATGLKTETTLKCNLCGGAGSSPCKKCLGLARIPCAECRATGGTRGVMGGPENKAGSTRHGLCKGSGYAQCDSCKSGKTDCPNCKKGEVNVKCVGCRDSKTVRCHGCGPGSWIAFEVSGRILHVAGRHLDAAAFYTTALELVTGAPVNEDPDFPERKRAAERWLAAERERIEAAAAAADRGKPPPSAR